MFISCYANMENVFYCLNIIIAIMIFLHVLLLNNDKVTNWISEILKLAEVALTQPQLSCAAYAFGLNH